MLRILPLLAILLLIVLGLNGTNATSNNSKPFARLAKKIDNNGRIARIIRLLLKKPETETTRSDTIAASPSQQHDIFINEGPTQQSIQNEESFLDDHDNGPFGGSIIVPFVPTAGTRSRERAALASLQHMLENNRHDVNIQFSRDGTRVKIMDHLCECNIIDQQSDYKKGLCHFTTNPFIKFTLLFMKRDYSDNRNYERFLKERERLQTDHSSMNNYLGYTVDAINNYYVFFLDKI